jgi:DNA-binding winged helix-turn-helix (wHTH) protein
VRRDARTNKITERRELSAHEVSDIPTAELRKRSFGVLRHLAPNIGPNTGRVVTKYELSDVNQPGVTVTEDSLTQIISEIRRALGDTVAILSTPTARRQSGG